MRLFDFVADAGDKLADQDPKAFIEHVGHCGLDSAGIDVTVEGSLVTVVGEVASQDELEKIVLALGNIRGIARVKAEIEARTPGRESRFVIVKPGDTLSAIARDQYGDASKYMVIFEANKPPLTDPDKITPGTLLRVPEEW